MNQFNAFTYPPVDLDIQRSTWNMPSRHKTTMSAGLLYPFHMNEVLPGDTFTYNMSCLARMLTPIVPVLDDAFVDIAFFFVPNRITWDHWKEFMGESPKDPYINPVEYSIPQLRSLYATEGDTIPEKSVMDYIGAGVPHTNVYGLYVNALPIRAFGLIWNTWYRDQNLMNAIDVPTDDTTRYWRGADAFDQSDPEAYVTGAAIGGELPPVCKFHDYFTSATLQQQKGDPVAIPLEGFAPVVFPSNTDISHNQILEQMVENGAVTDIISATRWQDGSTGDLLIGHQDVRTKDGVSYSDYTSAGSNNYPISISNGYAALGALNQGIQTPNGMILPYSSIVDLRYAFQMQKYLERNNRYGTRYHEIIRGHFNVNAPDAEMQIPEFLGSKRIRVGMQQVVQQSSTNDVSPLGNVAAFSLTGSSDNYFTKSFTEHGYIIGVLCIRNSNSYQQGYHKFWRRRDKFDFYTPEFAHVGDQPIFLSEIFVPPFGSAASANYDHDKIFGYQEAFAEYRYMPDRISGEMRSDYSGGSLDYWHYADWYEEAPTLSSEWIRTDRDNIDRTLAVQSDDHDQFQVDIQLMIKATRPMPMYSIPGLADHF